MRESECLIPTHSGVSTGKSGYGHLRNYSFLVGIVLIVLLSAFRENDTSKSTPSFVSNLQKTRSQWNLIRSNYNVLPFFNSSHQSYLNYKFLGQVDAVIEPYAPTALIWNDEDSLTSLLGSVEAIKFSVCSLDIKDSTEERCIWGVYNTSNRTSSIFVIDCAPLEKYEVNVFLSDLDGRAKISSTFKAMCTYVRREIRSLATQDLNTTMNAMAVLWTTTEENGQALYGSDFHNITYFSLGHYFSASLRNADHIHQGLGFLPQHLKFSNAFELAMQSVDKSVALPYWDFTIDQMDGSYFVFQSDTFGSLTFPSGDTWTYANDSIDDARIQDGRWADLRVERGNYYPDSVVDSNVFHDLRGAWSLNPSAFLTRFATKNLTSAYPSCSEYYTWLKLDTLEEFLDKAEAKAHDSAHDSVGGQYGCDTFQFMVDKGWANETTLICYEWVTYMKSLWRDHYLAPDKACMPASDDNSADCGFLCDSSKGHDMMSTFVEMANSSDIFNQENMDHNAWSDVRHFICEGDGYRVFFGDHRESGSSSDPSFWTIHPTLERAYHAKVLAGGFSDWSWPNSSVVASNPTCYRSSCYNDQGVEGYYEDCCIGHYEGDGFPNFISGNISDPGLWMTNGEYLAATDPSSEHYAMTYIYDSFSWAHCGDDEHAIDYLLRSMYES